MERTYLAAVQEVGGVGWGLLARWCWRAYYACVAAGQEVGGVGLGLLARWCWRACNACVAAGQEVSGVGGTVGIYNECLAAVQEVGGVGCATWHLHRVFSAPQLLVWWAAWCRVGAGVG